MGNDEPRDGAGRRYSGLAAQQRTSTRRAAVLAAALELFGTAGYSATSVKDICREAGLTERYFYESFSNREAALTALYEDLVAALRYTTTAAIEGAGDDLDTITLGALSAFIGNLTRDPRRARVIMIEVVGVSPALEQRRHQVMAEYSQLTIATWAASTHPPAATERQRLIAAALVGAVNHLLVEWLQTGCRQSPAALVDASATLFSAASARLIAEI